MTGKTGDNALSTTLLESRGGVSQSAALRRRNGQVVQSLPAVAAGRGSHERAQNKGATMFMFRKEK
jgi:hypothetical protein